MPLFHFGFSAMASVNELQIWADAETDARRGADAAIADVLRIEAKYSFALSRRNSLARIMAPSRADGPVNRDAEYSERSATRP